MRFSQNKKWTPASFYMLLKIQQYKISSFHERSEWNGRKFTQKKILARPHRGRGMLSVRLSVRP
jgi:hypothetical protein